jgi:hypothetical protein
LQKRRTGPSTAERERTIALLSDRFAQGELEMEDRIQLPGAPAAPKRSARAQARWPAIGLTSTTPWI